MFCAPGKVAAQVGLGVLAGGAQGSHCQPQLVSEQPRTIGGDGGQFGVVHDLTLRLLSAAARSRNLHHLRLAAIADVSERRVYRRQCPIWPSHARSGHHESRLAQQCPRFARYGPSSNVCARMSRPGKASQHVRVAGRRCSARRVGQRTPRRARQGHSEIALRIELTASGNQGFEDSIAISADHATAIRFKPPIVRPHKVTDRYLPVISEWPCVHAPALLAREPAAGPGRGPGLVPGGLSQDGDPCHYRRGIVAESTGG